MVSSWGLTENRGYRFDFRDNQKNYIHDVDTQQYREHSPTCSSFGVWDAWRGRAGDGGGSASEKDFKLALNY